MQFYTFEAPGLPQVTIVAEDHERASLIFGSWIAVLVDEGIPDLALPLLSVARPATDISLRLGAAHGVSGIVVRDAVTGWRVAQPQEGAALLPRRTTKLFFFEDEEADQYAIFATTKRRAQSIFQALEANPELIPAGWFGGEVECWHMTGHVRHQRAAEVRGEEGVGIYAPDSGWTVLALDYASLGLEPSQAEVAASNRDTMQRSSCKDRR